MIALTYTVHLLEPVLLTTLDGDPNSKVSLNHLPGSAFRGAFAGAYAAAYKISDLASHADARRLFFTNTTRFLNAYPIAQQREGCRTLPTPRSWHLEKGTDIEPTGDKTQQGPKDIREVFDFSSEKYSIKLPDADMSEKKQWKWIGRPFRTTADSPYGPFYLVSPRRRINIHTTRNRAMGRATDTDGQVFRYEALAEDQAFCGVILCEERAVTPIMALVPEIVSLGGAGNAGYGRIEIDASSITQSPLSEWREYDLDVPTTGSSRLVITMLSDAILRDANGQTTVSPKAIERELRKIIPGAELIADNLEQSSLRCAFLEEELRGGFNRKWGLPLPQIRVCAMGSAVIFNCADWTPEQIAQLETEGIGERRNEGFGRVGVSSVEAEIVSCWADDPWKPRRMSTLSTESVTTAVQMANRLVTTRINRRILEKAANYEIKSPPSRSQISRLRSLIQAELIRSPQSRRLDEVTKFVSVDNLNAHAETQYHRAQIDGIELDSWIREICNCDTVAFGVGTLAIKITDAACIGSQWSTVVDKDGNLSLEAAIESKLRFLDAVLARAAKQKGNG